MVRRKQTTQRKTRSRRFLYPIPTEASYTSAHMDEVEIMKFINKEAAKQRRAKVNRMAGLAFGEQALRSYTAAQKKQRRRAGRHPPMRKKKKTTQQKTCLTLMELAQAFPNIAQQVCFYPKQSTFNSLVGRVPRSKQKVVQWL